VALHMGTSLVDIAKINYDLGIIGIIIISYFSVCLLLAVHSIINPCRWSIHRYQDFCLK
jgi:hypothetical protein